MPVIINELVFKGTITAPKQETKHPAGKQKPPIDQETLLELCVEEVLKVLERQKER